MVIGGGEGVRRGGRRGRWRSAVGDGGGLAEGDVAADYACEHRQGYEQRDGAGDSGEQGGDDSPVATIATVHATAPLHRARVA